MSREEFNPDGATFSPSGEVIPKSWAEGEKMPEATDQEKIAAIIKALKEATGAATIMMTETRSDETRQSWDRFRARWQEATRQAEELFAALTPPERGE
jgi:hypothetical protein